MRIRSLCSGVILGLMPGLAMASDAVVPERFQGIYATPSCEEAEFVYGTLAKAELYVDLVDGGAALSVIIDVFQQDDWTVVVPDEPSAYWLLRAAEDGAVEVAFPLWPTEEELAANPDLGDPDPYAIDMARIDIDPVKSVPCETLPPDVSAVHGEGYAFLRAMDAIALDCHASKTCLDRLFAALDVSGDGRLNHAEIARSVRIAAYLSVFGSDFFYETDEFLGAIGIGSLIGPVASEMILRNFDYGGDAAVSLDELLLDRPGLRAADFPLSMMMLLEDDDIGEGVRSAIDELGRALP